MPLIHLRPGASPMFPPARAIRPWHDGLVGVGGDLRPDTLLEAYQKGIFPWEGEQPIPWFSPDPRLVLDPSAFRTTRSLEKRARNGGLEVRFDTAFEQVMRGCGAVPRRGQAGTWITEGMVTAYGALHARGVGHSVEVWHDDRLVGGLYGLALGRAFFGESMFHLERDASKLALRALCHHLAHLGYHFVDCQQDTPHLRSMGAHLISRGEYLDLLEAALIYPDAWVRPG